MQAHAAAGRREAMSRASTNLFLVAALASFLSGDGPVGVE